MQRTSDFDLMVASQLAGDSAMFALLGGKRDPKRPTDHEAITGQEPT